VRAVGWIDRRGASVLPRNECVRLLWVHAGMVGRIGVVVDGRPLIMPVNYRMLGEDVLVEIGPGTMLEAVDRGSVLAFEADSALPPEAWSVYVRGPARRADRAQVQRASPGGAALVPEPGGVPVVIRSDVVSGRRFEVHPRSRGTASPSRELGTLRLPPPVRVPAGTTIKEAAATMGAAESSAVVVGDHRMALVSEHDLVAALAAGLGPCSPVGEVASGTPLWVTTTSTVEDAAAVMARHNVQHLLVITADGMLVGVLSRREALRRLIEERDQSPWSVMTSAAFADG